MSALQITAITLCFTIPLLGWALLFRRAFYFVREFRNGTADSTRTNQPGARTMTVLREFLGHTRMSRLPVVAIAHWFTAVSFFLLFATLVNAFFQLIWAEFRLPIIGHFPPFEWLVEIFSWGGFIGIILLIIIRQKNHPRSSPGRHGERSRFFGSNWWQAYYVEATILGVTTCILLLRTLEARMVEIMEPGTNLLLHFPLTGWMRGMWGYMDLAQVKEAIYIFAMLKILISFAWMITVSLVPTMGVAWHRFLAFPNIWFKRNATGRTALGAARPMMANGKPMTMEDIENMGAGEDDEAEPLMGVGKVEDFTWKNLLDFYTCTECGRCQSQCPAWNTDKPLSPKLLVMTLRDHAQAKAPWLMASEEDRHSLPKHTKRLVEVPLIGDTGYEAPFPIGAYDALGPDAIIDADVLWSCTTCGACVEQCPVDIEHVDAILDMRRHQVLLESAFPAEFGGLFKNMETKQNPWGMAPKMRLDWTKGLEFDVPVVGADVEDLTTVDYLFWVGCAGAFEDRAKKTTRAVAELLHTAGVSFAVLGEGEACTGDSARRAGNEILFQMLAAQNIEMLNESRATKIVVTCAHCYNTIRNEYAQLGAHYEVLHHTQLLNRLVRERKLIPVSRPEQRPGLSSNKEAASTGRTVTYHDPCYLGRHNHVYSPPRDLIGTLPGVMLKEMPRHGMKSFCCGAGGARMWAEEKLGKRVNLNRTDEAIATGADRIAIGCPFCRVMLSDGLTARIDEGNAREDVEVVDIAQMLLASLRPPVERQVEAAPAAGTGASTAVAAPTEAARPSARAMDVRRGEDEDVPEAATADEVPPPEETAPASKVAEAAKAVKHDEAPAEPIDEAVPTEVVAEPEAAPAPAEAPKIEKPKGKMSASEALAAMAGAGAVAKAPDTAPEKAEEPATSVQAPAAKAAAQPEHEPAAKTEPQPEAAKQPAAKPAATSSGRVTAAAWAELVKAGKERGKIPASEALAMLGGAVTAAPSVDETEPAPAPEREPTPEPVAEDAATEAKTPPEAEVVAAAEPEVKPESAPERVAEPDAGAEPEPRREPEPTAPDVAEAKPKTPASPRMKVAAPSAAAGLDTLRQALGSRKSMPASEALALLSSVKPVGEPVAQDTASDSGQEAEPEPAPAAKAEPESKPEPSPAAKAEPEPAPAAKAEPEPAPAAKAELESKPEPSPATGAAARSAGASSDGNAAWAALREALGDRTMMPASEALEILRRK